MDNYLFNNLLASLKKEDKKKGKRQFSITPLNFENFQIQTLGDGKIDLKDIAALYEWAELTLKQTAWQLSMVFRYHPDSPNFWLIDIDKKDDEGRYSVGIDLESFIESTNQKGMIEAVGSFIPDNYELAKKVFKEFQAIEGNVKYKFEDTSFRDLANWDTRSKKAAMALGKFIDDKYVQPALIKILERNNIESCEFTEAKSNKPHSVDFTYKK